MTENLTDAELAAINERARALVDELLHLLEPAGDRQCAYLSASQILISRAGLDAQEILDAVTSLIGHNLFDDAPIRLVVVPPDGGDQPESPSRVVH